jgi:hypothetical protein
MKLCTESRGMITPGDNVAAGPLSSASAAVCETPLVSSMSHSPPLLLLPSLQVTFEVRNGTAVVATATCTTDATGRCKATMPASTSVTTYNVVASAQCGTNPVASSPAQVDWVAVPGQLLLNIPLCCWSTQVLRVHSRRSCSAAVLRRQAQQVGSERCTEACKQAMCAVNRILTHTEQLQQLQGTPCATRMDLTRLKLPDGDESRACASPGMSCFAHPSQDVWPANTHCCYSQSLVFFALPPAVTFELRNTAGAVVSTFTAVTDATGLARATPHAQATAVKYSVTATATPACSSTTGSVPSQPKPGSGTTLEWITQPDTMTVTVTPGARVTTGTPITLAARLVNGTTPVPGKVVVFNGADANGTTTSVQCTTAADGTCSVTFVRPTPAEVTVTTSATGSLGIPVKPAAPVKLEW